MTKKKIYEIVFYLLGGFFFIGVTMVSSHATYLVILTGSFLLTVYCYDNEENRRYFLSLSSMTFAISLPFFLSAMLLADRQPILSWKFWALFLATAIGTWFLAWIMPAFYVFKERMKFRSEQRASSKEIEKLYAEWGEILNKGRFHRERYEIEDI